MAIDFEKWNQQYGGSDTTEALEGLKNNNSTEYAELPDGSYICKLEKLELGEAQSGKPMIKGMFRITEGQYHKMCIFYNQVFCRSESGSAFSMHKGLEFLRSLKIFDDSEVDFNGNYADFNDLLLDMAEEAEESIMTFKIRKTKDGDFTRIECIDVFGM